MLQGTLGGVAFWVLGLPSPLLWGVVMTLLCIIPLAGAPIVWVPSAIILAIQGEYFKAIGLALWGWLVVGTVDNITRPFIIGGRTSLHPLAVFFAILGGLFAVGGVGVFLGPVLLSVTLALLDILRLKLAPNPPGPTGSGPSGPPLTPTPAKAPVTPATGSKAQPGALGQTV
jgi:predicted PurR-regulated permease PerM